MPSILDYSATELMARGLRAVNKFGMNLADFAAVTQNGHFDAFGNGTSYTVGDWISDGGIFDNLSEAQTAYPIIQSGTDTVDWVLLQSAIDFLIYGSLGSSVYGSTKRRLFVPAGLFKSNHPLQVGYAAIGTPPGSLNGNGYASITIEGEGPHYDPSGNGMTGTTIDFTYTDDVGIALNKNVQTILRGFTIRGSYNYLSSNSLSMLNGAGAWDLANWKDPALSSTNWIGGAAVNVGIGIDVYSNTTSAAAYPARILPSYFGGGTSTASMGSSGGSDYLIEDVNISNFVVGIGRPHGDNNSEFIKVHRGLIAYCPYSVTIGHSQSRNVSFRDTNFFGFHTAFTNEGGTQTNGNMHGAYDNCHAAYGYQLVNNTQTWSGPIKFSGAYVEGVFRIGSSSSGSLAFDRCYFSIYDANGTGLSAKDHVNGVAAFYDCSIVTRNGLIARQRTEDPSPITLVNCSNIATIAPTLSGNAGDAIRYMNGVFGISGSGLRSITANIVRYPSSADVQHVGGVYRQQHGKTHAGQEFIEYASSFADSNITVIGASSVFGGVYRYPVPRIGYRGVSIGTMSARSGYDMTFPRLSIGSLKADEGDVFYVRGSGDLEYVCVVTSISGSNMVLRQLNGYFSTSQFDYATDGNTQMAVSSSYTADYVCTRVRYNAGLVIGTMMNGSPTITNVKHALGSGNAVSTSELTMAAGDYFIHPEEDMLNVGGSPVSPLNLVAGVNTGAQTITLTNNYLGPTKTAYPVVFYVKVFNA